MQLHTHIYFYLLTPYKTFVKYMLFNIVILISREIKSLSKITLHYQQIQSNITGIEVKKTKLAVWQL